MSTPNIQQDLIKIKPSLISTEEKGPGRLRVSDGGNRMWLLSTKFCGSWFVSKWGKTIRYVKLFSNLWQEFLAHFGSLSDIPEDEIELLEDGVVRSPDHWASVIKRAQKVTVNLIIRTKW